MALWGQVVRPCRGGNSDLYELPALIANLSLFVALSKKFLLSCDV